MELEIQQTTAGVRVRGEMTIYSAVTLKAALLGELAVRRAALELDLAEVVEFDTAGLQLVVLLERECSSAQQILRIVACSDVVRAGLQLCCKDSLIGPSPAGDASAPTSRTRKKRVGPAAAKRVKRGAI